MQSRNSCLRLAFSLEFIYFRLLGCSLISLCLLCCLLARKMANMIESAIKTVWPPPTWCSPRRHSAHNMASLGRNRLGPAENAARCAASCVTCVSTQGTLVWAASLLLIALVWRSSSHRRRLRRPIRADCALADRDKTTMCSCWPHIVDEDDECDYDEHDQGAARFRVAPA